MAAATDSDMARKSAVTMITRRAIQGQSAGHRPTAPIWLETPFTNAGIADQVLARGDRYAMLL
jgi:hypothetical protein